MEEWSFEVEWSQILCSLVGFTKTNTELFCDDILQHSLPFNHELSFLNIFLVCFVVALRDLVHDVESIHVIF